MKHATKIISLVLALSFMTPVKQTYAGFRTIAGTAIGAGIGYLFGRNKASNASTSTYINNHLTNVNNIYLDTSGIERDIE